VAPCSKTSDTSVVASSRSVVLSRRLWSGTVAAMSPMGGISGRAAACPAAMIFFAVGMMDR